MEHINKDAFFGKYGLSDADIQKCGLTWEILERIYMDYTGKYERGHWDRLPARLFKYNRQPFSGTEIIVCSM